MGDVYVQAGETSSSWLHQSKMRRVVKPSNQQEQSESELEWKKGREICNVIRRTTTTNEHYRNMQHIG